MTQQMTFRSGFGDSQLANIGPAREPWNQRAVAVIEKRVGCYDIKPTPLGKELGITSARVATGQEARETVARMAGAEPVYSI